MAFHVRITISIQAIYHSFKMNLQILQIQW